MTAERAEQSRAIGSRNAICICMLFFCFLMLFSKIRKNEALARIL